MCNDIKTEVENSLTGTACARHADRMANGRDRVYADNLVINQCRRRKLLGMRDLCFLFDRNYYERVYIGFYL